MVAGGNVVVVETTAVAAAVPSVEAATLELLLPVEHEALIDVRTTAEVRNAEAFWEMRLNLRVQATVGWLSDGGCLSDGTLMS